MKAGEGGGPRGLDLSFIEQAKKQEADRNTSKAESALDDLLDEAAAPSSQPAESKQAQEDTEPPKKRSRDEILRSLREGGGVPATEKPSKFRKVGDKSKTAEAEQTSQKQSKKVKKKVKKVVKKEPAVENKEDHVDAAQPRAVDAEPPVSQPPPQNDQEEQDDDMDIFAGADYSGLSDSGSDSADDRPTKSASARTPADDGEDTELAAEKKSKATWFDDDENEEADAIKAPSIPQPPPPSKPQEDAGSGDADAQAARSEIRAMLDADKAAERDEKRKERKQRWREKQGLGNREGGVELEGASKPIKEKKLTEVRPFISCLMQTAYVSGAASSFGGCGKTLTCRLVILFSFGASRRTSSTETISSCRAV